MKVGGKKSWEHNGLEPASCHTSAAGSAIELPGQAVRSALSIVVVSVRSVLNITSGCCVLYTWKSKQNHHLASLTRCPWVR